MPRNIVIGQKVTAAKWQLAKRLRRQMTPEERTLWEYLRANRLGGFHFRRQQVICGYIVDFYCHSAGLAIELDGEVHNLQANYDRERDEILSASGIRVLRFKNRRVNEDLEGVIAEISANCSAANGESHGP